MAFPLLKRLTEVGEIIAKRFFKEEIVNRFLSGVNSDTMVLKAYLKISLSGINIEKFVKKLPTPEELKDYYMHNKDKINKDKIK